MFGYVSNSYVKECYNIGTVTAQNQYVGGITGRIEGTSSLTNCYNRGTITGLINVGGIAGLVNSDTLVFENSYNNSSVVLLSGGSGVGQVTSTAWNSAIVSNSYYNSGTQPTLAGCTITQQADMTSQSFVTALNASQNPAPWTRDGAKNDGCPIFSWQ